MAEMSSASVSGTLDYNVEGLSPSRASQDESIEVAQAAGTGVIALANKDTRTAIRDCIIKMLDEMDIRADNLRTDAMRLENERDDILSSLDTLNNSEMLWRLEGIELDEIKRYLERIQKRTAGLQVDIKTERSPMQMDALNKVNQLIDSMILDVRKDAELARKRCAAYINACSETLVEEGTGIDTVFETSVLGCAADDQKRIKKRLMGLQTYFLSISMEVTEECSQEFSQDK